MNVGERTRIVCCIMIFVIAKGAGGAAQAPSEPLDPGRNPAVLHLPEPSHLTEQFIWTRGDAAALNPALQAKVRGQNDKVAPHYFRAAFQLKNVPASATLYLAGPRSAHVLLNGSLVLDLPDDGRAAKGFSVSTAAVAPYLRTGKNSIAIEAVRGHSSLHTGASATINQVTYGEVLLVKIVPQARGVDATPVLGSDTSWRSTLSVSENWSSPDFDDSAWPSVDSLGIPGTKSDFLQWNADAGLYAWPGYSGIGSALRTFRLPVSAVRDLASERAFPNRMQVFEQHQDTKFTVLPVAPGDPPPALTVDLGREINGRLHLVSDSDVEQQVETSYGESPEEAMGHPYLGPRIIVVPPYGEAFGPKSGFRYARLTFLTPGSEWTSIDAEGITYPVDYAGSFESSDPVLNRIWETAAYTAHLCMQEGIWDAPKRDRGRWMGDLDVTGRVINSVFADKTLMEQTMQQVIGSSPVERDVNTIAGYSALWITGQADFYRHQGDRAYLQSMHAPLLELLSVMDRELDGRGLFTNPDHHKVFVDWSSGFNADLPDARAATQFEFYLAYREAVYLLTELGDSTHAAMYQHQAEAINASAHVSLLDPTTSTYGLRWQTNAMAVVSGAATTDERRAIWQKVLRQVDDPASTAVVTPYYGFYVLSAMASLDHRSEALDWMHHYWGGMLDEGATSFWEAYDPHWPKQDFHAFLEADNKKGYYVSLAHGWASGPAAWLMEEILGIEPTGKGFASVTIRPDLAGLKWARGSEPTPRGPIQVDLQPDSVRIVLPNATTARVLLPFQPHPGSILQNGNAVTVTADATGLRSVVTLQTAGEYVFTQKKGSSR